VVQEAGHRVQRSQAVQHGPKHAVTFYTWLSILHGSVPDFLYSIENLPLPIVFAGMDASRQYGFGVARLSLLWYRTMVVKELYCYLWWCSFLYGRATLVVVPC
jgi:hypothetical protein